jgi:Phytochelatin synthase
MRRIALYVLLSLLSALGVARAETLPLPSGLIALDSAEGERLFFEANLTRSFFPLSMHFVTQVNPAFCGPASIAMVLNALNVPRTPSDLTTGLGMFDQDNVFTPRAELVKARAKVERGGMTLDELGGILAAHDLKVEVHHAADTSLEAFRNAAINELAGASRFVLVNYLRSALGQKTSGHISPLAAYDAATDRFLILDVSRYKYPPVWVEAPSIFAAMNTADSDAAGKTRGYVIVGR